MEHITAIILGVVEGATEFIPVSSSGHLIIVREILGQNGVGDLSFDAVLQLSATLALIVYFWRDLMEIMVTFWSVITRKNIVEKEKTLLYSIAFGTIPAIIFGLLLETKMETVFRNVELVSVTLILGSFLMWFAEKYSKRDKQLSVHRGIIIGFFQCLALVPGVSRSGATISGGLLTGLTKEEAVRFSFILSIPILLGSGLKKLFDIYPSLVSSDIGLSLFLGSLSAFVVGLLSINFLIKYLRNHSLNVFVWYRVIIAVLILTHI